MSQRSWQLTALVIPAPSRRAVRTPGDWALPGRALHGSNSNQGGDNESSTISNSRSARNNNHRRKRLHAPSSQASRSHAECGARVMRRRFKGAAFAGMLGFGAMSFLNAAAYGEPGVFDDRIVFGQSAAFDGPAAALGLGMREGI